MNWISFPKTEPIPEYILKTIEIFEDYSEEIDSTKNDNNDDRLSSDKVLSILEGKFTALGYRVEKSKKSIDKVRIPVLYGELGKEELAFEADAFHKEWKTVIEVEAGRAFLNYQFLKDIFQASMMMDTNYLILAVRNLYKGKNDFSKIKSFIEVIYLTNKIKLDLKGIILVGY